MKLTPWTIITIGICIAAVILTVGFFQFWDPKTTEAGYYRELERQLNAEGNKLPAQEKKFEEAVAAKLANEAEWNTIVGMHTPPTTVQQGGINLGVNRYQLVLDAVTFRNNIQRDVNRQIRAGGVKVIRGPEVPNFPDSPTTIVETGFNYPALGAPVRVYDFGTVEVEGTYDQIRRNINSWSFFREYMAVADGLRIQGTTPRLRATYNLSMVMFIRAQTIFPPVPEGGAQAGGDQAGGGAAALGRAGGF